MISVIIPAHNEESVIARCLESVLKGARPGELEVIVACNGCKDRTAAIARGFGAPVKVVEIDESSKVAAINAAELVTTSFPRVYIDADVELSITSIRKLVQPLIDGRALMATPDFSVDLSRSSWPVRAFYRVWTQLDYNKSDGRVGSGVYSLSGHGRARFGEIPRVINDDGFVRLQYKPGERMTVYDARSYVEAPRTIRSLIRAKTRVRRGIRQLQAMGLFTEKVNRRSSYFSLAFRPLLWPSLPVYYAIVFATKLCAASSAPASTAKWNRDDSRPVCA